MENFLSCNKKLKKAFSLNKNKLYNFIFLFFLLIISSRTYTQGLISGPQFRTATLNSLDVTSSHLILQQAQSYYNSVLNNISFTHNVAPAKLFFNDGSVKKGKLSRSIFNVGFGYGKVDKIGCYGGLHLDRVKEVLRKKNVSGVGGSNTPLQGLGYIGIVFLNFQLDIGTTMGEGFNLDGNYDFTEDANQIPTDNSLLYRFGGKIFTSFYHKTGVYGSAAFSEGEYNPMIGRSRKKHLSELKINIQPLKKYLPDIWGLPFIDLTRYDPFRSYVLDNSGYYSTALTNENESAKKEIYEFKPGTDNLFGKGIRISTAIQVYPKRSFKKVELCYTHQIEDGPSLFGIRGQLYNNNGKSDFSFDSFIMLSVLEKYLNFSISYSYNSPQNVTFLPLSHLNVIGIQIVIGKRETAKSIIPFVVSAMSDEMEKKKK